MRKEADKDLKTAFINNIHYLISDWTPEEKISEHEDITTETIQNEKD